MCLRGSGDVAPSAPALTRGLSRPVSTALAILPEYAQIVGRGPVEHQSTGAAQAALGQVILDRRPGLDEAVLGAHGGQHGEVTLDLAPDAAERDAEHPLT